MQVKRTPYNNRKSKNYKYPGETHALPAVIEILEIPNIQMKCTPYRNPNSENHKSVSETHALL